MVQISNNKKLLGQCLPTGTADLPKQESHVYNQLYSVFERQISFEKLLNLCPKLLLNNPKPARMQPTLNGNRQMAPVCTAHRLTQASFKPAESKSKRHPDRFSRFCTVHCRQSLYFKIRTVPIMRPLKPYRSLYNENAKLRGARNL